MSGGVHSVHFPPITNGKAESLQTTTEKHGARLLSDGPGDHPAIVIWGKMCNAERHLKQQIVHLPSAEHDYHGTLRMIVTAANAIAEDAKRLLKMLEKT